VITARMSGFEVLERLRAAGYELAVTREPTEPEKHPRTTITIRGDAEPGPELAALIESSRDNLKAAALLSGPPDWLAELCDLYRSGHETPVKRSSPSGGAELCRVSVSIENIAAEVAAEIGMPVLEWERILPEVEEALGS
jgi:hypothetical protein